MLLSRKILIFLLLLTLFFGGCATINDPMQGVVYEGIYLKDLCERYNANLTWDSISQVVTVKGRGIDVRGMVGSDTVFVGQKRFD